MLAFDFLLLDFDLRLVKSSTPESLLEATWAKGSSLALPEVDTNCMRLFFLPFFLWTSSTTAVAASVVFLGRRRRRFFFLSLFMLSSFVAEAEEGTKSKGFNETCDGVLVEWAPDKDNEEKEDEEEDEEDEEEEDDDFLSLERWRFLEPEPGSPPRDAATALAFVLSLTAPARRLPSSRFRLRLRP